MATTLSKSTTSSKPSGISNVVNTYKAIAGNLVKSVTGKDLLGTASTFTATTSSPTANKVIQSVAQSPFITAGVIAGGITAVKYAPALYNSATGVTIRNAVGTSASAVTKAVSSIPVKTLAKVGGVALAGYAGYSAVQNYKDSGIAGVIGGQAPTLKVTQPDGTELFFRKTDQQDAGISQLYDDQGNLTGEYLGTGQTQITPDAITTTEGSTGTTGSNWLNIGLIAVVAYLVATESK